jgi:uncharacterized DUF497 family protein
MKISFDPAKRQTTLDERDLDFADAGEVFEGYVLTRKDERRDYGEDRYISVGELWGRTVVVVWTSRRGSRRIISMRDANVKETRLYKASIR